MVGARGARCLACDLDAVAMRYYGSSGKNNLRFVPDGVEENVNLINPPDNNPGDGGDNQDHIQRVGSRGQLWCALVSQTNSRALAQDELNGAQTASPRVVGRDSSYSSRGRENRRWAPVEVSPRRATHLFEGRFGAAGLWTLAEVVTL